MRIHDGAYGTLLERHLRGGETADDLCLRDPTVVVDAHRAYLEAGATAIQTNAFLAHLRDPGRRRRDLQLAALDCARDASATVGTGALVVATVGPAGDQPRDFWGDIELVLDAGAEAVLCETVTTRAVADAFIAAWNEVAHGVQVEPMLGCSVAPSAGDPAMRWVLELASDAPAHVRLGLNCCEGTVGLRPLLEGLVEQRETAWLVPSAGVPSRTAEGTTEWPLADPAPWVESLLELVDGLPVEAVGGCCGTTPRSIARLAAEMRSLD